MIYTVTLNPSLDYLVSVNDFREGIVNRTANEAVFAGGKGINVSLVLHELGAETMALGFLAGFTGDEIAKKISETGCREDFIRLKKGFSRINIKLKSETETEINGMGADISEDDMARFLINLDNKLEEGDVLVLSGSVPRSLDSSVYGWIAERVKNKRILLVADATGALLKAVLPYRPFLVKPNHHELGALFGVSIETHTDAIFYSKSLQEMGAVNVLVSMAEKGAVLVTKDAVYETDAPKGTVLNSVGAGDSMVAGFLFGFLREKNFDAALHWGVAAGSASAFSENLATKAEILQMYEKMYLSDAKNSNLNKNI